MNKTQQRLCTLLLALLTLPLCKAHAEREAHGGSYVVIDGQVTVADPYYAGVPSSKMSTITEVKYSDFPQELRDYVDQTEGVVNMLISPAPGSGIANFFANFVRSDDARYFLVPKDRENNVPCDQYLPILDRPVDAQFQYGCTFHGDTYLFISEWNQAPIGEQALALLHERLWAYMPNIDQKVIASFIGWADILEKRYIQQVKFNNLTPMPASEKAGLREFFATSATLNGSQGTSSLYAGVYRHSDYTILNGGGILLGKNVSIDNKSFIGIGSVITSFTDATLPGPKIENSVILTSTIGVEYVEIHTAPYDVKLQPVGTLIQDSRVVGSLVTASQIIHSKLNLATIELGTLTDSTVDNSTLTTVTADHSSFTNSAVSPDLYSVNAQNNTDRNSLKSKFTYTTMVHSACTVGSGSAKVAGSGALVVNGSQGQPVVIKDSVLAQVGARIDEGSSLNAVSYLLSDVNPSFLMIGAQSTLDHLNLSKILKGYEYLEVNIGKSTSLSNGTISFNASEHLMTKKDPVIQFNLGSSNGKPFRRDFDGKTEALVASCSVFASSCSATLP